MADEPTPKHARKIDDLRRVVLPKEFTAGDTVVLQPVEKDVWLVSTLKTAPRHFVEADSGPVI
jgi:hypothetical protein